MRTRLLMVLIIVLVSCGPNSGSIPAKIVAPKNDAMSEFGFKVVELPRILNLQNLQGERFRFVSGPNISKKDYAKAYDEFGSFEEARENLKSLFTPHEVSLNLVWGDGYYTAADFDSLYMMSAYYQFEKVADFLTDVVLDSSRAARKPVYVGVYGSFTTRGIFKIPSGFTDNSAYLPLADIFKMYRVADQEGLPFEMNPGVVAHEFHHRVFHDLIFESQGQKGFEVWRALSDPETTNRFSRARILVKATDEALADVNAVAFTGNVNFLALSQIKSSSNESANDLRNLQGEFADSATYDNLAESTLDSEYVSLCKGDSLNFVNPNWKYYCLSTVIARTIWDASSRNLEILRNEFLPAINRSLVSLSDVIVNDFGNYDLDKLWQVMAGQLSAERRLRLCEQVQVRFESLFNRVPACA